MNVRLKLFATAKQAAAADEITLALADGATVADVRRALIAAVPALQPAARHLLFAVDAEYATDSRIISAADEVACIPPVSGG